MNERAGRTLLLVEDEALIALGEADLLRRNGFTVETALNGEEAIARVHELPQIDLVLMDIDLGYGPDGTEAARRILKIREIPIVFLTGHAEREMVERVRNITRYGYVLKTSGEFVLLESIAMAFELFDTTEKLRESERRYRWIADNSTDGVALIQGDRIVYASEGYRRLIGVAPSDIEKLDLEACFAGMHPDDEPHVRSMIDLATRSRSPQVRYRYRVGRPNGGQVWLEDSVAIFYDEAGERAYSFVNSRDVTEEEIAREELARREREYRALFDGAINPIVLYDREGTIVQINEAGARGLGSTPEDVTGRRLADFLPQTHDLTIDRIAACLEHEEILEFVDRVQIPDGRWRSFQSTFQPVHSHGERAVVQVISYDITEEERAKAALEASRNMFSLAFNRAPTLMSISTIEDGTYLEVNERFVNVTGYTREETIGTRSVDLGFIAPADRERLKRGLLDDGHVWGMELQLARKDGTQLDVLYYGELIEVGGETRLLSMAIDITDELRTRRAMETVLREKDEPIRALEEPPPEPAPG